VRRLLEGADVSVRVRDAREANRVRLEKGFTQARLAMAVGTSQPFIHNLFSGQRTCSLEVALKIYEALGLDDVESDRLFRVSIRRSAKSSTTSQSVPATGRLAS
jgi:transcriptional regulator with XRE-family HTH domain